jgi:flagellar FliJ protein
MARQFHFPLDRVLDYRRQVEDQAMFALAQARRLYQDQTALVDGLRAELDAVAAAIADASSLTEAEMWLRRRYKERLAGDVKAAEAELQRLARELAKRREETVLRSKERKILETLKARQAKTHALEEDRREQKELDEIGTLRHVHRGA